MSCSISLSSIPVLCDGCEHAPHIGENGNWYVGDTDTGVKAQGPAGQDADGAELERINNTLEGIKNSIGNFKFFRVGYNGQASSLEALDNPTKVFGPLEAPYIIFVQDDIGTSPLGGGISMVIGYTYSNGLHGAQIALSYSTSGHIRSRSKANGTWSAWRGI